jgi:hypothetical protein
MFFCTAINCMDGRTQLPVNDYLRNVLNVEYVDTITEPGPPKILAEQQDSPLAQSILSRLDISVNKHGSKSIALVAHHDCAGNPAPEDIQRQQLQAATKFLAQHYPDVTILALWVDSDWTVHDVPISSS